MMTDSLQNAIAETEAANFILTTLEAGRGNLPAVLAAGAMMKAAVLMARALDQEAYPQSCRTALENILTDLQVIKEKKSTPQEMH